MRSASTFLAASALATGLFGIGLLVSPGLLVSLYGLHLDGDGTMIARLLAAMLLGFAVLDSSCRRTTGEALRRVLVAGLVAEVVAAFAVVSAALTGTGNGLLWSVAGLFIVFASWRVLVLGGLPG